MVIYVCTHLVLYLTWVNKNSLSLSLSLSLSVFFMYLRLSILKIQRYVIRDGYPTFVNNRRRQNSPMTRRISFRSCVYTNQLRKYTRATLLSHTESRRNPQAGILIDRLTNLQRIAAPGLFKSPSSNRVLSTFFPNKHESARRHAAVMSIFAQLTDEIGPHLPRWRIRDDLSSASHSFACKRSTLRSPRHRMRRHGDGKRCIFFPRTPAPLCRCYHRRSESVRCEISKIYGYQLLALAVDYFMRNISLIFCYNITL